jgi:hypothetical protein
VAAGFGGCLGFLGQRLLEQLPYLCVLAAQRAFTIAQVRPIGWVWPLEVDKALGQGPLDG